MAVLLAALTANLSTERAPSRLNPVLGWGLTLALFALAVAALVQHLDLATALAVALAGLMVGIPGVSAWIGWRQQQSKAPHGA
ncbi:MAG: hypothetical protein C0487_06790 [Leptothrix sp. (in: Bacteria)]|nr:hypothetical protein [Leptothrix sp. (in: b-proteobacteria)]